MNLNISNRKYICQYKRSGIIVNRKTKKLFKGISKYMDPIFQIGKNGITENFIKQVDDALEAREIIKIKVLNNSFLEPKEVANDISRKT